MSEWTRGDIDRLKAMTDFGRFVADYAIDLGVTAAQQLAANRRVSVAADCRELVALYALWKSFFDANQTTVVLAHDLPRFKGAMKRALVRFNGAMKTLPGWKKLHYGPNLEFEENFSRVLIRKATTEAGRGLGITMLIIDGSYGADLEAAYEPVASCMGAIVITIEPMIA